MPSACSQSASCSPPTIGDSLFFGRVAVRHHGHTSRKVVERVAVSSTTRTHMLEQESPEQHKEAAVLPRLSLAEEHQQAELQGSSPARQAAGDRAALSPRDHFGVAASGLYPAGSPPCPLPEAVLQLFPQQFTSVTSAKRACRRGEIWLDGTKLKTKSQRLVQGGQTVQWLQRMQGGERLQDMCVPAGLHVVYEDTDLACVAKPQGMPVAGKGGQLDLQTALPRILSPGQGSGALWRPRYVHRLDQPTGGLVMAAKSRPALSALSAAFSQREVKKTYLALLCGRLVGRGSVQYPLEGKPCLTMYQVLGHTRSARHNWVTTVKLHPHTGRRHQLRRHMALIGHPVVNDKQYTYGFAAQMLRSGSAAQHSGQGAQGGEDSCNEVECDADAQMCVPDEAETSCSTSSDSSLEIPMEDNNSADIALGRFGREPAARSGSDRADPDVLSAATAVQRWELDHSHSKREGCGASTGLAATAPGGLSLHRPVHPGLGEVDASLLCLWAVGLSLTHPRTGVLMNFEIEEPGLFDAVREREFQAWREL